MKLTSYNIIIFWWLQKYIYYFFKMLKLCKFVWIINMLVTGLVRILVPAHSSILEVMWARECTSTFCPYVVFSFELAVDSIHELGGAWLIIIFSNTLTVISKSPLDFESSKIRSPKVRGLLATHPTSLPCAIKIHVIIKHIANFIHK